MIPHGWWREEWSVIDRWFRRCGIQGQPVTLQLISNIEFILPVRDRITRKYNFDIVLSNTNNAHWRFQYEWQFGSILHIEDHNMNDNLVQSYTLKITIWMTIWFSLLHVYTNFNWNLGFLRTDKWFGFGFFFFNGSSYLYSWLFTESFVCVILILNKLKLQCKLCLKLEYL